MGWGDNSQEETENTFARYSGTGIYNVFSLKQKNIVAGFYPLATEVGSISIWVNLIKGQGQREDEARQQKSIIFQTECYLSSSALGWLLTFNECCP